MKVSVCSKLAVGGEEQTNEENSEGIGEAGLMLVEKEQTRRCPREVRDL